MANQNLTSKAIPTEVLEAVLADITKIETALKPYLITLTKEERTNRSSMGDKSVAFVMKAHEDAIAQPQLVPSYVDLEAWNIDVSLIDEVKTIVARLSALNEQLSDTRLESGSEAYTAALLFYAAAKEAAKANIPGAKAVVEDLKARFPGKKGGSNTPEENG